MPADDLARCDREITEIINRPDVKSGNAPAWLVAMGMCDWTVEKRLIERETKPFWELGMLKLGCVRFRGKCSKHPHYDPHVGQGAIKGGCQRCQTLYDILIHHSQMLRAMREFSPPKDLSKFRLDDDRQMGLFEERA